MRFMIILPVQLKARNGIHLDKLTAKSQVSFR